MLCTYYPTESSGMCQTIDNLPQLCSFELQLLSWPLKELSVGLLDAKILTAHFAPRCTRAVKTQKLNLSEKIIIIIQFFH